MDRMMVIKAIADDTRMTMMSLLIRHNYCVRALAEKVGLSESTISQHLKVLREAGLLTGEKRGYFMHYSVNRSVLHELAKEIEALANTGQEAGTQEQANCSPTFGNRCHKGRCSDDTKEACHGTSAQRGGAHHGSCKHQES